MPIECTSNGNPLQRELADAIIRYSTLDDLRILLACGARADDPVTQGLRPLHYAVWQRYHEAVHLLMVRGAKVDSRDDCGYTPLHLAAEYGYVEILEVLTRHQDRIDFGIVGSSATEGVGSKTLQCDEPLRLAIKNNHFEAAKFLLEHGANPNTRYFFGCEVNLISPLNTKFLELLLMHGAFPDTRDRTGITPLMKACRLPQGLEAVALLLKYGADVNACTDERHDYRSVLHYAVLSGNPEMVQLMIKHGALVNPPKEAFGYDKPSPLDLTILKGDVTLVKLLIEMGADVNKFSPLLGSALHIACADRIANRHPIVEALLANGANPNIVVQSEDGLSLQPVLGEYLTANQDPSFELVQLLLKYGAQVIFKSQYRHSLGILNAIPYVASRPDIVSLLLEAGEQYASTILKRITFEPELRDVLVQRAATPLSLKKHARIAIRHFCKNKLVGIVDSLEIPQILAKYLLFEIR